MVTVTVKQLDQAEGLEAWQGQSEEVLNAMQPPVTRAELTGTTPAGVVDEDAADLNDQTDVVWLPGSNVGNRRPDDRPRVLGDVVTTNGGGTALFTFDYGEGAADITHIAYLRTNRDSADAEDELFELKAEHSVSHRRHRG